MKKVARMAKVVRSEITSTKLAEVFGGYGGNSSHNDGGSMGIAGNDCGYLGNILDPWDFPNDQGNVGGY